MSKINRKKSAHSGVQSALSRRSFLNASAAAAATTFLAGCASSGGGSGQGMNVQPDGPAIRPFGLSGQRIRVGVIGSGYRGRGAAWDAIRAADNVEVIAMGDLFKDRVDEARKWLTDEAGKNGLADRVNISDDRVFSGFDNYKQVLATDCEMVILATPPGFRPQHLKAAIESGKHVFMEKPVAVDPAGVRSVIASADLARQKNLAIVSGTQRRHQMHYLETMARIHDGAIGDIVAAQCYWNQGALWVKKQEPTWSDMEWQCRNWLYFCWLSGDHIVEQHVHNLDVVNWALKATPVKCVGMGGRQQRVQPEFGNIYDHFSVEYEYPGGVRVLSMCRQIPKTSDRVAERLVGTQGVCRTDGSVAEISGSTNWKFDRENPPDPYVQEHADLIASIREGKPLNEGRQIAESTLTAIMGRMSAYTGREISWDWAMNASKLDLTPPSMEFGALPVGDVPIPGVTALV